MTDKKVKNRKEDNLSLFYVVSNKIMPPAFFFLIALVSLHYINKASSSALILNLSAVSLVCSIVGIMITYLVIL